MEWLVKSLNKVETTAEETLRGIEQMIFAEEPEFSEDMKQEEKVLPCYSGIYDI